MSDLKDVTDDLTSQAAIAAGRSAAKRAIENVLSSDEERAEKEAEQTALAKRRRTKLVVYSVVGLLLVLGVVGMVLSYWQWFFLLGLIMLGALYGRYRWRKSRARGSDEDTEAIAGEKQPAKTRVAPSLPEKRVSDEESKRARTAAAAEQAAADDLEIEREMAELKARLKK